MMATFGAISLLLSGTGVFGVLAFVAGQRHREMAVRLSLGATRRSVFALVLSMGGWFALTGGAIGLGLAWWMGRLMSAYVFEVSASNALVLSGSALLVASVVLVGAIVPALRAASVHPSRALRP